MNSASLLKRLARAAAPSFIAASALLSAAAAQAQNLEVYLSPPSVQNTVVPGALIEPFERPTGSIGASGSWNIGAFTAATGRYDPAGVYGGAGRTGNYLAVAGGPIDVAVAPGYRYLGFWWSAGDASNAITFYDQNGVQLTRFTTADINALLSGAGTVPTVGGGSYPKASFFGNPNAPGGNTGEPYAYVNLILTNTTSTFGSIRIEGSNFELDNLSLASPIPPANDWVPVTIYPVVLAAVNDSYATPAGQTLTGNVADNDAAPSPGVTPTYAVTTPPPNGSLTLNPATGAFSYTPNPGFTGVDSFTYNRCRVDAPTVCSPATVNITVFDAVNDSNSTLTGQPVAGNAAGNDAFPSGSTFTAPASSANGGTVGMNPDGSYTYTPAPGFSGIDSFSYTLCLPAPNQTICDTATVSIAVRPDAVNDSGSTAVNVPLSGSVAGNDVAAPPGSAFTPLSGPANGTLSLSSNGSYVYTPAPGYAGPDSFAYQVCLPSPYQTLCDAATVTLSVTPDARDDAGLTPINTPLNGTVGGNDVGVPAGAGFSVVSGTSNGSVTLNADGSYVYTPAAGYTGPDSFSYRVCLPSPNQTLCDTATVQLTVFGAVADQAVTRVDTPVSGNVASNDLVVPANSTFSRATDPAHGSVTVNPDGTYTYTPAAGYRGVDSFTYQVCAPSPNQTVCHTATVTVNVLGAVNDQAVTTVDTPVSGNVAANDGTLPPGATFAKATDPAHGTVVVNPDGSYTYTPAAGYRGPDSFTYQLCSADVPPVCSTATVELFVMQATDDVRAAVPGAPTTGSVAGNDTVPPGATFSGPTTGPAHGSVTVNPDGSYTYQSDPAYQGEDAFTYQVCAPALGGAAPVCTTATVRLQVRPPAPVPTLSQWSLLLLAALMAAGAVRRRRA